MENKRLRVLKHVRMYLLLSALIFISGWSRLVAQTDSSAAKPATTVEHDGQHDFDFAIGSWKIHLKQLQHPLTGSKSWVEFDGTVVARTLWDGRSNVEEFEAKSPTGAIEGLALRLYNRQTHQWSIWANGKNGVIDPSPQVGQFKSGHGEFYGTDTLNGKLIYVRFVWTNTDSSSPHFEQSYSDYGGKTWEVNWITEQTRVQDGSDRAH
jgi:hypothetical protein